MRPFLFYLGAYSTNEIHSVSYKVIFSWTALDPRSGDVSVLIDITPSAGAGGCSHPHHWLFYCMHQNLVAVFACSSIYASTGHVDLAPKPTFLLFPRAGISLD